ncbi:helix-turn-helix domain-containing protein [Oryzomonas sagensis]|uniref:Helix-turn-helix domain-containing protein n=1 Tax=Oryzomonas sagensis TaxID=2603857 RepID=A0ABQ6TQ43_9BACT|nr:helix-turn-helix domain-containing protein [Oryzomonas sagensis]KAB0671149.1 helix-turn-helix domain-containing protein [Oryzomonas sagensis]
MRDLKIGIKDMKESAEETRNILRQFDQGIFPEQPIERIYFNDFKTLLRYITPKRLVLLETLHKAGAMSINALAKLLNRSYKNVYDDIKVLELVGLVERDEQKRIFVPWNEIATTLRLAA